MATAKDRKAAKVISEKIITEQKSAPKSVAPKTRKVPANTPVSTVTVSSASTGTKKVVKVGNNIAPVMTSAQIFAKKRTDALKIGGVPGFNTRF